MYGLFYRHVLLPFFDGVWKGRRTVRYWKEFEASQWWSADQLATAQQRGLRNLLQHAWSTCPYYRRTWGGLGITPQSISGPQDLAKLPLLTRDVIRECRADLRTLAPVAMLTKATGGSSGVPLQFDVSHDSHERRTAMMYRGYDWAGGAPGTRQLFLWGGALAHVSAFNRWKANLHHAIDRHRVINCFEFTPEKMAGHARTWNSYRADVVVAYVNPLYEFARHCEERGIALVPPKSIIVGAEKLHPFQRELIERVCGAPVFETYGSREFMLIGAECSEHAGLHLSQENLVVEVVDEQGRPTPDGEEGQVVITDLFNWAMPFIRYVNGDRAIAGLTTCRCGRGLPLLRGVTGRQLDMLETPDGRRIPGEFFPHLLKEFPAIRRFQVVQTQPQAICVRLVAPNLTASDEESLRAAILAVTGTAVLLELERVQEIPLTAQGKLRVVVREPRVTNGGEQARPQHREPDQPVTVMVPDEFEA
jgi:phenylacetate-CoA ligase